MLLTESLFKRAVFVPFIDTANSLFKSFFEKMCNKWTDFDETTRSSRGVKNHLMPQMMAATKKPVANARSAATKTK